jgi:hypothetical protein
LALTYVVGRIVELHSTAELGVKFDPFTVRVKADPPAFADVGETLLITGMFATCPTDKVIAFDVAPPGFSTVIATF